MKTTSMPSRTIALKVVATATVSQPSDAAGAIVPSAVVVAANARRSSCSGMTRAARSTALRSQLRPNSRSRTPMTS